jgi:K+/H+ antiporter YhaU regulatory subunit KhtT
MRKQVLFINDDGQSDMKEEINMVPGPEDEINQNDILVVLGSKESLTKLKGDK